MEILCSYWYVALDQMARTPALVATFWRILPCRSFPGTYPVSFKIHICPFFLIPYFQYSTLICGKNMLMVSALNEITLPGATGRALCRAKSFYVFANICGTSFKRTASNIVLLYAFFLICSIMFLKMFSLSSMAILQTSEWKRNVILHIFEDMAFAR